MRNLQRLLRSKYKKPLMGQLAKYAENAIEAAAVRKNSAELYDQLINAATLIMEETRILLPMYHKILFSDTAYAAVVQASIDLAAVPSFSQTQRVEVWRSTHHFSAIRWLNRVKTAVDLRTLIAGWDCRFERVLGQMERDAQARGQRATELMAWARLNQTALCQRNAEGLRKQWEDANK